MGVVGEDLVVRLVLGRGPLVVDEGDQAEAGERLGFGQQLRPGSPVGAADEQHGGPVAATGRRGDDRAVEGVPAVAGEGHLGRDQ